MNARGWFWCGVVAILVAFWACIAAAWYVVAFIAWLSLGFYLWIAAVFMGRRGHGSN